VARVTVEDCVQRVPNRFDLVMVAAQRSRDISAGATLTLDRDNDKNPVVALREIADETVEIDALQDALIRGLQKHVELDEPEEDMLDLMSSEDRLGALTTGIGDEFGQANSEATAETSEVEATAETSEVEATAETSEVEAASEDAPEKATDDQPEVPDADRATEPE